VNEHGGHGGMEIHTDLLARGLVARGHVVSLITSGGASPDTKDPPPFTLYSLEGTPCGVYSPDFWTRSRAKVVELHSKNPIDAVLGQSIGARAVVAPGPPPGLNIPAAIILHGIPIWELRSLWATANSPKRWLSVISGAFRFLPASLGLGRMLAFYNEIVAVSEPLGVEIRDRFPGLSARITTIPNGIEMEGFKPDEAERQGVRARFQISENDLVLLLAGRLVFEKGFHHVLKAVSQVRPKANPLKVWLVGDGPESGPLRRIAEELGIQDRCRFIGGVARGDMPHFYQGADLVCLPSLRWEAHPLTLIEAMATGRPVIASNRGGIPAAVEDGSTGFLVDPGDTSRITTCLEQMISDPQQRACMGKRAREVAVKRLSLDAMLESYELLLVRMTSRENPTC